MKNATKKLLQRLLPLFWTRPSGGKKLYLTFDDGPFQENTASILKTLERYQAKGTFFMVGAQVAELPDLARRIEREGHAVGLHGLRHINPKEQGCFEYVRNVVRARDLLQSVLGTDLERPLLRPPYGYLGPLATLVLLLKGYRIAMWNVDPLDFRSKGPEELVRFVSRAGLQDGDILLFHDDCPHTAAALPAIIEELQGRGFRFGLLDREPAVEKGEGI